MNNGISEEKSHEELKKSYLELEERLEEVNKKLLRSEQLKSDFLSNIKNEINNPLTSILGLLNQIIAHPEDVSKTARSAKLIHTEAYALNFQMKNIFHAAEIEAGQSFPHLTPVAVNEEVTQLVKAYKHQAEKKSIGFELYLEAEESFVADREKLEMMLSNIIDNAIKFSPNESKIIIRSSMNERGLSVSIQDFAMGIEEENLHRIFDRFKQLDSGTRKGFGGHGLGLSIVHALVDMLDGSVNIDTEVGEGSTFEIVLPVREVVDESIDDDEILFDTEGKGEIF